MTHDQSSVPEAPREFSKRPSTSDADARAHALAIGASSSDRSHLPQETQLTDLPEPDQLAIAIISTLRTGDNTDKGMTVSELNGIVADEKDIATEWRERPSPNSETLYHLRMRYARIMLRDQAGAIDKIYEETPRRDHDEDRYSILELGYTITDEEIRRYWNSFRDKHPSGRAYRDGSTISMRPREEIPWQYNIIDWCKVTLQAIADASEGNGDGIALNNDINRRVAELYRLTPQQRDRIFSLQNPIELEYKARTATARSQLRYAGLAILADRGKWRVGKEAMIEEHGALWNKLKDIIEMNDQERQAANYFGPTDTYRGNPKLIVRSVNAKPLDVTIATKTSSGSGDSATSNQEYSETNYPHIVLPSDLLLCNATLRILAAHGADASGATQKKILTGVAEKLEINEQYLNEESPPWCTTPNAPKSLYKYRMMHVLRALSTPMCSAIRAQGMPGEPLKWKLTERGSAMTLANTDRLWETVTRYFTRHSYQNWKTEKWMHNYIQRLKAPVDEGDEGDAFEGLCADLLRRRVDVLDAKVVQKNSQLDTEGIDIVAWLDSTPPSVDQIGDFLIYDRQPEIVLFVQCKRLFYKPTDEQPIGKMDMAIARYDARARQRNYIVAGGLVITCGDLSQEATNLFWRYEQIIHANESIAMDDGLRWDVWDGGKLLQELKDYQIGLLNDEDGGLQVDHDYLSGLGFGVING